MRLIVERELGGVGFEGAAEGAEAADVAVHAEPGGVAAAGLRGAEDVNVGTAVAAVVLAAAAALRAGHDPLPALVGAEEDHDVGDGRLALGPVGVFPEEEVARLEIALEVGDVGQAAVGGGHVPRLALEVQVIVLVGGGAGQIDTGDGFVEPARGVRAVHGPRAALAGRAPVVVVVDAAVAEGAGGLEELEAPVVGGTVGGRVHADLTVEARRGEVAPETGEGRGRAPRVVGIAAGGKSRGRLGLGRGGGSGGQFGHGGEPGFRWEGQARRSDRGGEAAVIGDGRRLARLVGFHLGGRDQLRDGRGLAVRRGHVGAVVGVVGNRDGARGEGGGGDVEVLHRLGGEISVMLRLGFRGSGRRFFAGGRGGHEDDLSGRELGGCEIIERLELLARGVEFVRELGERVASRDGVGDRVRGGGRGLGCGGTSVCRRSRWIRGCSDV